MEMSHMMFGFALIALLAIVGFVGMGLAATSNSNNGNGISDAACRAMAENVRQNAQTVIDNPNAVQYADCSSISDTIYRGKDNSMQIWKLTQGCLNLGSGISFDYAAYTNREELTGGQNNIVTNIFEQAQLHEYPGGIHGFYSRYIQAGNRNEPQNDVPGSSDSFSSTFDIPSK